MSNKSQITGTVLFQAWDSLFYLAFYIEKRAVIKNVNNNKNFAPNRVTRYVDDLFFLKT